MKDNRLPPGQSLTTKFPVLTYGDTPTVDRTKWRLLIDGLVENPVILSWDDFISLPKTHITSDFHCVTRWSRYDNGWTGVSIIELLKLVTVLPEAKAVMQHSYGGYTTNLLIEDFVREPNLIAYEHDGKELEPDHGYPARSIVPHLFAWKSAKWINRIEFMPKDKPGFWERNGYHMRGEPFAEERYSY